MTPRRLYRAITFLAVLYPETRFTAVEAASAVDGRTQRNGLNRTHFCDGAVLPADAVRREGEVSRAKQLNADEKYGQSAAQPAVRAYRIGFSASQHELRIARGTDNRRTCSAILRARASRLVLAQVRRALRSAQRTTRASPANTDSRIPFRADGQEAAMQNVRALHFSPSTQRPLLGEAM